MNDSQLSIESDSITSTAEASLGADILSFSSIHPTFVVACMDQV